MLMFVFKNDIKIEVLDVIVLFFSFIDPTLWITFNYIECNLLILFDKTPAGTSDLQKNDNNFETIILISPKTTRIV